MKLTRMLLTVSICVTALIGDYIVFKSKYSDSQAFRAFSDSSVHASIGFLSALIFFSYDIGLTDQARAYNIGFCTVLSSLIDVDHFIAAKSFRLKDLTHLKQRGIFHCTTFWFMLTAIILVYASIAKKLNVYILTFMTIIAFTSHHVRDANRRGLWFYPFGHTPPLTKYFYIFLLTVLPRLIVYMFTILKPAVYKHTVIYHKSMV